MSESLMLLHFLFLFLFCCVSSSSFLTEDNSADGLVACSLPQIQALTRFKNEFDSSSCNQTDYFSGIRCDNTTGALTMLQLPRGCFTGILKPNSSLFGFHQLRYLKLSYNNFASSSIPFEFGNLNKLEVLSLSSNGFIGQVPSSFSNLSMLSQLDLSYNKLTGSFPIVQNLSRLTVIDLSNNYFSGNLNPNSSLFELHHLRYLNLQENFFGFSLPLELGNLNKLEYLSLSYNGFSGRVPPTISNLTSLIELRLVHNQLTGSLPLVQNLTNLSVLDLRENHFTGTLPSSFLIMPFLSSLSLGTNNLSGSIEVPNSFTSSRLELLDLGFNNFKGRIVEPILNLINLKTLSLSYLNISYPINISLFSSLKSLSLLFLSGNTISPASLRSYSDIPLNIESLIMSNCNIREFPNIVKNWQNLELIDVSNNRINGKIPEWLWRLPRLTSVFLRNNSFNGFEGSEEMLVNSSVRVLDLFSNSFEGSVPSLPRFIKVFIASTNRFTKNIPLSICNRSLLKVLDLSRNNLTGPIPQCMSNFTFVSLRKNNLKGSISDSFHVGASLRTLDVGFNRITGKLPRSLQNCSSLEFLVVDNNEITDTFPFWLKVLPNLQVLTLRSNKFYGPISLPHQGPLGFPELRILEISDNSFIGSLSPRYFENWKASSQMMSLDGDLYMMHRDSFDGIIYFATDFLDMHYKGLSMEQRKILTSYNTIDFSGNKLEGQIPESIGLLKALIALNLSNNAFTGHIPLSLENLVELESLDLSRNQLFGTIPRGFGSLSFLAYINVSHNQLTGEIPQGTQIIGQPKSSFQGNAGLCGLPLLESCFETNSPLTQQPKEIGGDEEEEKQVLNWKAVVIGYGAGVLFGLAIAQVIASYKPRWLVKIIGLKKLINR